MKRRICSLALTMLLLLTLLGGCGSTETAAAEAPMRMDTAMPAETAADAGGGLYATAGTSPAPQNRAETAKRIYTATLELETTDFDAASEKLTALVERSGGWFASSSVNNRGSGYRYGGYVVRVPAAQFAAFCAQVGELCHLTYSDSSTEDVSEYYYDTAGRLKTQQTKLERLQDLLAKAETMEDIITVESAISDTESAIEALSGELQHYDALVDYSTVSINLSEVYKLSNVEEPATGFGSRIGAAFVSGWQGFVDGLESLAVALAYGWMWVLALAVVAAAAVQLLRKRRKSLPKMPKKTAESSEDKTE